MIGLEETIVVKSTIKNDEHKGYFPPKRSYNDSMRKEIQNNSEILNANISSKQPSSNVNSQADGWIYICHFSDPLWKAE